MDFNELNKRSYDKIAAKFSSTRGYVWTDMQSLLEFVHEGDKVLDLGCGNGRIIETQNPKLLVKGESAHDRKNQNYLGVDFSGELIDEARKKFPEYNFERADALSLADDHPELAQAFDVVLCVAVLNHFSRENQRRFIENVKAVLKPGGYLLMLNWNLWNARAKKSVWRHGFRSFLTRGVMTTWKSGEVAAPLYYYAFTKSEIKRLLKKNGFETIKNYYSNNGAAAGWLFGKNIVTVAKLK